MVTTDHYDPRRKVLRLSPAICSGTNSRIGCCRPRNGPCVSAQNYVPPDPQQPVPGSQYWLQMAFPLFVLGLFFQWDTLMLVGIWFFIAALAFQIVTLPVEFNASRRAIALLSSGGYITSSELPHAKAVLDAAALTYVSAVAMAASQLIRLLILRNSRRN